MQINSRLIIGALLIILGVGFLIDRIAPFEFGEILRTWWALAFVVIGALQIINRPEKLTGGLIMIALGSALVADNLFPDIHFWGIFMPLLLIIFGIGFLLRDKSKPMIDINATFYKHTSSDSHTVSTDEVISVSALFSGSEQTISSKKFRGGKVSALFGGVELDLRHAEMASSEASLDVEASFGGVEIKVPQHWHVIVQGSPVFGGISNETLQRAIGGEQHEQTLTIRANVVFGGLEITN
ncbi:MAG: hypothetical protein JNL32_12520 [Candidatus Kapabacteria bacterium]|nr:hypothetical protein [Candidatus Kapabacteria bacterium]